MKCLGGPGLKRKHVETGGAMKNHLIPKPTLLSYVHFHTDRKQAFLYTMTHLYVFAKIVFFLYMRKLFQFNTYTVYMHVYIILYMY